MRVPDCKQNFRAVTCQLAPVNKAEFFAHVRQPKFRFCLEIYTKPQALKRSFELVKQCLAIETHLAHRVKLLRQYPQQTSRKL